MHFVTKRSNFKYFKKLINTIIRYIFKRTAKPAFEKRWNREEGEIGQRSRFPGNSEILVMTGSLIVRTANAMEPADKAKVAAPGRRVEMLSRYSTARVGVQALSSFHYPLRGQPINEEIRGGGVRILSLPSKRWIFKGAPANRLIKRPY